MPSKNYSKSLNYSQKFRNIDVNPKVDLLSQFNHSKIHLAQWNINEANESINLDDTLEFFSGSKPLNRAAKSSLYNFVIMQLMNGRNDRIKSLLNRLRRDRIELESSACDIERLYEVYWKEFMVKITISKLYAVKGQLLYSFSNICRAFALLKNSTSKIDYNKVLADEYVNKIAIHFLQTVLIEISIKICQFPHHYLQIFMDFIESVMRGCKDSKERAAMAKFKMIFLYNHIGK
ncbi:MAG: hypothetical protein MHMPM18_003252 [Marteilia pararefringens]